MRDRTKPIALRRPRKYKRRADALLTRHQVFAAYELYKRFGTVTAVAELGWWKWGYASKGRCVTELGEAFALEALTQMSGKPFRAPHLCAGCHLPANQRTYACKACRTRHYARKRRGLPYVSAADARAGLALHSNQNGACIARYRSAAARQEARRRSWRESKRRASQRRVAA